MEMIHIHSRPIVSSSKCPDRVPGTREVSKRRNVPRAPYYQLATALYYGNPQLHISWSKSFSPGKGLFNKMLHDFQLPK